MSSRTVFHAHSSASRDSEALLENILQRLEKQGVSHLFLTDHNKLTHSPVTSDAVTLIPSEEIDTQQGEIIGIFLKEEIKPFQTIKQTLDAIHQQGGLAVAPHPFDRLRSKVLRHESLLTYLDEIDIIEVFNARTVFRSDNKKAYDFARQHKKPMLYGSDAHTLWEYCNTRMEGLECASATLFLESLSTSKPHIRYASLFVHAITKYVKWKKQLQLSR